MGIDNFNNAQLKEMMADPKSFFQDSKNVNQLLGLDQSKRRLADVMKYDMSLNKNQIQDRLGKLAKISGVSIDI
jgi:hypothetical protein